MRGTLNPRGSYNYTEMDVGKPRSGCCWKPIQKVPRLRTVAATYRCSQCKTPVTLPKDD